LSLSFFTPTKGQNWQPISPKEGNTGTGAGAAAAERNRRGKRDDRKEVRKKCELNGGKL
jgi:hypothetical protein